MEEDFPRRTRSKITDKSEKRVPRKNAKAQEDTVLFKDDAPKRTPKRKIKQTKESGRKGKKFKTAKSSKRKPADDEGDDDDDDDDDDDLGLDYQDDSDDDEDDVSEKPKRKKEKAKKKKEQKKGKNPKSEKQYLDDEDSNSGDESEESEDEGKKKKRRVKPLKGSLDEDVEAFDGGVRRRLYVPLSHKTISTDMLLLGVVKEVRELEIVISLPGGSTGFLAVTDISDVYTNHLERLSNGDEVADEEIPRPKEVFRVGTHVACKVKSAESTPTGRPRIQVTVKPSDVNGNLIPSMLRTGMVLSGSVCSKEDHGYMVDLGIGKVKAFLGWKEARRYITERNLGQALYIGQPIQCLITKVQGNGRSLVLNADPTDVTMAIAVKESHNSLQTLLPGTKVTATVVKASKDYILVTVLDLYSCHIAQQHLEDNSLPVDHYKIQQQVTGVVICNNLTLKTLALSLNPSHHASHFDVHVHDPFKGYEQGHTLETARVLRVDAKTGLLVKIHQNLRGLVLPSNLPDNDPKKMKQLYRSGQKVNCRIIAFSWFDGVVMLSMKKSTLEQPYLGYHNITPGIIIEAAVFSFSDKGVKVQVADRTFGFIPYSHLGDIPISRPKDKYKVGDMLKCRVLTVDPSHRRLVLTHKKTMVESKLPIIADYAQAEMDMILHGFIVAIKDYGCLVSFYNDVKGLIPTKELGSDPNLIPTEAFHFSQVVKCHVIQTHPASLRKITLSLRSPGTQNPTKPIKQIQEPKDVPVGQIVSVKVTRVEDNGLLVSTSSGVHSKGFIPTMHLSDHHDNCAALLASYQEGDVIEEAAYWTYSKQKWCPILTCKQSILKTCSEEHLTSDLASLKAGTMLMGHVIRIMPYGVFVEANNNLVGLAPKKNVSDNFITKTDDCFKIGQTVRAHVTEVNSDKGRFLISLKLSQCPPRADEGQLLLEDYLMEREVLCKRLGERSEYKHIVKLTPGSIVSATVTEIQDGSLVCAIPGGVTGIINNLSEDAKFDQGDEMEACVLHNNLMDKTVFLSTNTELMELHKAKGKKTPKKSTMSKGKKEACIEFIHDHFELAFIPREGFVYLTRKQHLNDIKLGRDRHNVGQTWTVAVKKIVNGHQLAHFVQEKTPRTCDAKEQKLPKKTKAEKLDVEVGHIVSAVVSSVKDVHLFVTTDGGISGRIHPMEITDDLTTETSPLEIAKVGDKIQAKVISHREIKEHKFLPISHKSFKRMGLELSMRKSVIENDEDIEAPPIEEQLDNYKHGQSVMFVAQKYHNNLLWVMLKPGITGKVYQLNLSKRVGILNDPEPYFRPGTVHQGHVISVDKEQKVVELTLAGNPSGELSNGVIVNGRIYRIDNDFGLRIQLAHGVRGSIHVTDIHDVYKENPFQGLTLNQCIRCFVLSCDKKDDIILSTRPSLLGHKSKVQGDRPPETIADIEKGQLVTGYVKKASKKIIRLSLSRTLVGQVPSHSWSSEYHITRPQAVFPSGKMLTARVISVDKRRNKLELSCRPEDTGLPEQIPLNFRYKEILKPNTQKKNSTSKEEKVNRKRTSSETSQTITEKEAGIKKKKLQSTANGEDDDSKILGQKKIDKSQESGDGSRRVSRRTRGAHYASDSGVEDALSDTEIEVVSKPSSGSKSEAPRLSVSAGFSWDDDVTMTSIKTAKPGIVRHDSEEDSSSSSEDESDQEEEDIKQEPVKKSKADKEAMKKAEEEFLYKTEHALMDSERTPESPDDFDRLVLSSPDSSLVWIRYMAYYLHSAEVEKARTVAERALKAISFREEQEKLNVWVAYMNLENMYGTEDTLMKVFERALKFNEPIKVFQQLANIYRRTEKFEAAEQLYGTMVKRFNFSKEIWIDFGMFLMKNKKQDTARRLMQRSFKSLDQKHHVDVIVKFGQMEFKFGEVERGKTMFENVLSNYPKRTDIWSVYLDMMIKTADIEATRHIFERVIHLSLSAKKMKFFFKRYLDFEKKFGSESTVDSVKQKAVEYVESKAALPTDES